MRSIVVRADARTLRAWDGALAVWVALWLVVGVWVGYQIWQLTGLSDSAVQSGRALQSAGQALRDLGDVPLVGDRTRQFGGDVLSAGQGAVDSGARAGRSIRALAVLIGLTIALGPTGLVLLGYLPLRLARRRETREIRTAVRDGTGGSALESYLAGRAVSHLSFSELRAITPDPADLPAGRPTERARADLARAELARLGLGTTDRRPR